jgi:hypothetical protein
VRIFFRGGKRLYLCEGLKEDYKMNEGQTGKRVANIPVEVFFLMGVISDFLPFRYFVKSVFRYFGIRFFLLRINFFGR